MDQTYMYIDEVAIDAPTSELEHVVGWIRNLGFDTVVRALSMTAGYVHETSTSGVDQLEIARRVFVVPVLRDPIESVLRHGKDRVAIAPQTVTCLQRLAVLHACLERPTRAIDELTFERAIVGATALATRGEEEAPTEPDVLAMLVQMGALNARMPPLETLARWAYLYDDLARTSMAKARHDFCDIDSWLTEDSGLSVDQQIAVGFTALASTQALTAPDLETPIAVLSPGWCKELDERFGAKAGTVEALISAPREWFVDQFNRFAADHELSPSAAAAAHYTVPFDSRPFVRLDNGSLVLWSPRSLVSWTTEGLYHRAHASARTRRRIGHFQGFHAWLLEHYYLDLMNDSNEAASPVYAGRVAGNVAYDVPNKGRHYSSDTSIAFENDLVLIEVTSGRLTVNTHAFGTASAIEHDVGRLVVEKAQQMSRRIDDLNANRFEIDGADLTTIQRIWPIVVTTSGLLMTEPLWNEIMRRVTPALSQPAVQPLVVLDAYDLEVLAGLVASGHSLLDLLARKTQGPYLRLDWSRMVYDDPHLEAVRLPSVQRRSNEAFMRMADALGLDRARFNMPRDEAA